MNKEEMFKIFDACNPAVSDIREYLEQVAKTLPLDCLFLGKDGNTIITRCLRFGLGRFVGFVIDKRIYYTETYTCKLIEAKPTPYEQNLLNAKARLIHPRALPARLCDLPELLSSQHIVKDLFDRLQVFGYPALKIIDNDSTWYFYSSWS
jgi:hypothetical protein